MKKSYKIIFLGTTRVGKTSLICNYLTSGMQNQEPTIGIDFFSANMPIALQNGEEKLVNFQLWDTAGQEKYKSFIQIYLRNSFLAVIPYAINDRNSFEDIKMWVDDFKRVSGNKTNIVIVANKKDLRKTLDEKDLIPDQEGEEYANEIGARFCTASALKKADIEDVMNKVKGLIAEDILKNPNLEDESKSAINLTAKKSFCC